MQKLFRLIVRMVAGVGYGGASGVCCCQKGGVVGGGRCLRSASTFHHCSLLSDSFCFNGSGGLLVFQRRRRSAGVSTAATLGWCIRPGIVGIVQAGILCCVVCVVRLCNLVYCVV